MVMEIMMRIVMALTIANMLVKNHLISVAQNTHHALKVKLSLNLKVLVCIDVMAMIIKALMVVAEVIVSITIVKK